MQMGVRNWNGERDILDFPLICLFTRALSWQVCGKTFSKFDSLRRHVAELHKNIRPFVCELCNKTYGRKDYLDRHMRSHLVEGMKIEDGDSDISTIITTDNVTIDNEDIETTTTTVVVDTGDPSEEVVLPDVVTVVSNDGV